MNGTVQKWLLACVLAGALGAGAKAWAQNPPQSTEPKPGSNADVKEDQREAQALKAQIEQDKQQLKSDERNFGKNSPQAQADREKLEADRRQLQGLRRDVNRDRRIRRNRWNQSHPNH